MRRSFRMVALASAAAMVGASGIVAAAAADGTGPPSAVVGDGGQAHAGRPPGATQPPSSTVPQTAVNSSALVQGIDIGAYQHPGGAAINWGAVAGAGIRFAMIKATEGNGYRNPYYAGDTASAKGAGIYAAAYHFGRPDLGNPIGQADQLIAGAGYSRDGHTLPPMLDMEWPYPGLKVTAACWGLNQDQMAGWIRTFVSRVQSRLGVQPLIYTNSYWWDPCTGGHAALGGLPLVSAHWGSSPLPLPVDWSTWTMWQYSATSHVAGISGEVDADAFNGSVAALGGLAQSFSSTYAPTVVYSGPNSNAFATATDGKLYQAYNWPGRGWIPWFQVTPSGVLASAPTALRLPSGEIDIYALGTNHAVYEISWRPGTGWSGWSGLGGWLAYAPTAVYSGSNTNVFAVGGNGKLYQTYNRPGGGWVPWFQVTSAGALASAPSAVRLPSGEIDIYALASNHAVVQITWRPGIGWSGWSRLGGSLGYAPSASYSGSNANVFAVGGNGKLYQTYNRPGGGWVPWFQVTPAGILASGPTAVRLPSGEIDLYALGTNHLVYQIIYLPGHGWGGWTRIG